MLNSVKKTKQKKKYFNSCLVRKKNSERNKNHNPPPFKLNGRSLMIFVIISLVSGHADMGFVVKENCAR